MSFFGNIFGKTGEPSHSETFWTNLTSEEQLEEAIKQSFEKKVVLFKHSTRCIISRTVLRNFEKAIAGNKPDAEFYFLDLLQFRNISNKIAEQLGVTHQSPQLLVVKDGVAIKHASHDAISIDII